MEHRSQTIARLTLLWEGLLTGYMDKKAELLNFLLCNSLDGDAFNEDLKITNDWYVKTKLPFSLFSWSLRFLRYVWVTMPSENLVVQI